ncbi:MAG: DUF1688 family protein [Tatlockia sp.]
MNDSTVQSLQSLETVRHKAKALLALARANKLKYFFVDETKKQATVDYIIETIVANYPTLQIPYHSRLRHFEAGGKESLEQLQKQPVKERGTIFFELIIVSVLLDAGAGALWHYKKGSPEKDYTRSEGLALASLDLYCSGALTAYPDTPFRVDANPLEALNVQTLSYFFQVEKTNPLEGVAGRVALLNRLGKVIKQNKAVFGEEGRLGHFFSYVTSLATGNSLSVNLLFQEVLQVFAGVWPKRLSYHGIDLGDVFVHSALKSAEPGSEWVPFHKLSQWLTYSLLEPLESMGFTLTHLDALTPLPEYRNGGLLIDTGLLGLKEEKLKSSLQKPDAEVIVEWRALTIALIDELAEAIRSKLNLSAESLPLAKILQGGTWDAGRRIARQKRAGGTPPIQIESDGTLF